MLMNNLRKCRICIKSCKNPKYVDNRNLKIPITLDLKLYDTYKYSIILIK